jgi:flagellar basal-body rod protein FlgB
MAGKLDNLLQSHTDALKLRTFRQQLLASNIANADTPNYKAVDINFGEELKRMMAGGGGGIEQARTDPRHLSGTTGNSLGATVMYRADVQPNIDGNTVNMDVERAQFAENALRYEAGIHALSAEIKEMLAAIRTQ